MVANVAGRSLYSAWSGDLQSGYETLVGIGMPSMSRYSQRQGRSDSGISGAPAIDNALLGRVFAHYRQAQVVEGLIAVFYGGQGAPA
jgi:hypothetical protein